MCVPSKWQSAENISTTGETDPSNSSGPNIPDSPRRQKEYVNEAKYNEVKRLQQEGKGINDTATLLGIARQTVRKYREWTFFHTPAGKTRLPYHLYTNFVEKGYASGKELADTEIEVLNRLWGLEWFDEMHEAALSFWNIVKKKSVSRLLKWIARYKNSKISKIVTFVKGIELDLDTVKNTLVYQISNGIVEGYVNKLKIVKRMLYGKARLPLLQRNMIMPRCFFN